MRQWSWLQVENFPTFGTSEIFDNRFESQIVLFGGILGVTSKECHSIANIKPANNVDINELTKDLTIRETHFSSNGTIDRSALCGASSSTVTIDNGQRKWNLAMVIGFTGTRRFPSMSDKHPIDVRFTRELDVVTGLMHVKTIVLGNITMSGNLANTFVNCSNSGIDHQD